MNQVEKVDPTGEDIKRLLAEVPDAPVVMLNLLRYRPDGGREEYAEYALKVQPFLAGVGGELIYAGECATALVAPEAHDWDMVALVRYPSPQAFLDMVFNEDYQQITGIRAHALEAAVLQATTPAQGPA